MWFFTYFVYLLVFCLFFRMIRYYNIKKRLELSKRDGWKGMVEVKYLRESEVQETYVTTATLTGENAGYKETPGGVRVVAYDLDLDV